MEQYKLFPFPARCMSYGILWRILRGTARAVPPPCQVHELRDILDDTNVTDEHDSVTAILEG
ncbi:hypothetical protein DXA96_14295 [Lachnospiraceae bacterium OF09-33XD]|nr:hypothetical protein DXA96_14295 [Lachnospiraceae bacterium OF09-33XD]